MEWMALFRSACSGPLMDGHFCTHSRSSSVDGIGVIKSGGIGAEVPMKAKRRPTKVARGLALQKGRRLKGTNDDEDVEAK